MRSEIRAALELHLATVPGIAPTTRWSRENVTYDPVPGTPWVRTTFAPNVAERLTFPANGAFVEHAGLLLVDLFFPATPTGTAGADAVADGIITRFPSGQGFAGIPELMVTRALVRAGRRDGAWYQVPAEIGWYFQTTQVLV